MKLLFLILLFAVGIFFSYENYVRPTIEKYYPRELTLTNKAGEDIDVTIIQRDSENIYFFLGEDSIQHKFPLKELNFLSQCKVWLFPRLTTQSPENLPEKNLPEKHLNNMYDQYYDLISQIKILREKEYSSATSEKSAIFANIKALAVKTNALIYRINDFKYRYPYLIDERGNLDPIKIDERQDWDKRDLVLETFLRSKN